MKKGMSRQNGESLEKRVGLEAFICRGRTLKGMDIVMNVSDVDGCSQESAEEPQDTAPQHIHSYADKGWRRH